MGGPSEMKHPLAIGNILTDQKDFQNRKSVTVNHKGERPGSTLTIKSAAEGDAGIYTCQIKGGDGKQIKHTVCIGKCSREPRHFTSTASPQNSATTLRSEQALLMP